MKKYSTTFKLNDVSMNLDVMERVIAEFGEEKAIKNAIVCRLMDSESVKDLSDKELTIMAIEIPIKKWLGNYKKAIQIQAKKLDIWDEVYTGNIDIQDVIRDGFEKENIKIEYRKRIMKKIEENFL